MLGALKWKFLKHEWKGFRLRVRIFWNLVLIYIWSVFHARNACVMLMLQLTPLVLREKMQPTKFHHNLCTRSQTYQRFKKKKNKKKKNERSILKQIFWETKKKKNGIKILVSLEVLQIVVNTIFFTFVHHLVILRQHTKHTQIRFCPYVTDNWIVLNQKKKQVRYKVLVWDLL